MTRIATSLVVTMALIGTDITTAEARFFGNLPPKAGAELVKESRELAEKSLAIISGIYKGLADYEIAENPGAVNGILTEAASGFKVLSEQYTNLVDKDKDLKLTPDEALTKFPERRDILKFYGQDPAELSSLSAVAMKMAQEEGRLSENLLKGRFDGTDDPRVAIELYDALSRLSYLAAVYATINQTAE